MTSGTQWNSESIRQLERDSIRAFVESCAPHFKGRVIDFGCGLQPYRDIVEAAGGIYIGYDRAHFPGNVSLEDVGDDDINYREFDTVLCTQVIQYCPSPRETLAWFRARLVTRGTLVMTYPCSWDWIEKDADRWRFTPLGMDDLLFDAGLRTQRHEERAAVDLDGFRFPLGYGLVATA